MSTIHGAACWQVGPAGIGPYVRIACDDENIKKYSLRAWTFDARISEDGKSIDAGDGIHVGKWHSKTADQNWEGIRWADGNRWLVARPPPEQ